MACLWRFANTLVKGNSTQLEGAYQRILNFETRLSNSPKLSPALHVCAVQYVTASKNGPHKQSSLVLGSQRAFTAASFQQLVYDSVSHWSSLRQIMNRTGQFPTLATFTARSSFTPFGFGGIAGMGGVGGPASGHAIGLASATPALPASNAILIVIFIFSQEYICNDRRVPRNNVRGGPCVRVVKSVSIAIAKPHLPVSTHWLYVATRSRLVFCGAGASV